MRTCDHTTRLGPRLSPLTSQTPHRFDIKFAIVLPDTFDCYTQDGSALGSSRVRQSRYGGGVIALTISLISNLSSVSRLHSHFPRRGLFDVASRRARPIWRSWPGMTARKSRSRVSKLTDQPNLFLLLFLRTLMFCISAMDLANTTCFMCRRRGQLTAPAVSLVGRLLGPL